MMFIVKRHRKILIMMAFIFVGICFYALTEGSIKLTLHEVVQTLLGKGNTLQQLVVLNIRLPRLILTALIGMGLALSGCIIQCISRNPLADTGLLGINAGAGLFVILYMVMFSGAGSLSIPILAILGGGLAAVLVYILSRKKGEALQPIRMILTGVAVQAGLSALTILLVIGLDEEQYRFVAMWQAGNIVGASFSYLLSFLPWFLLLVPYIIRKSRVLDVFNFGDDIATGLGLSLEKERRRLLFASVALGAVCVACGGNIVFVGLVAPHIGRQLVGPRHKVLLPLSVLIGGTLVVLADTIGRTIIEPSMMPTGVMTAIIGAPYFIYLLMKMR